MDLINNNYPKEVKDKNIFKQGNSVYVRKIKKCICMSKQDDIYTLECHIPEHGLRKFCHRRGEEYLSRIPGEKKLWLCDAAFEMISGAENAFEGLVKKSRDSYKKIYVSKYGFYMYYRRIEKERYDFVLEFEEANMIKEHDVFVLQEKIVADLIKEIQMGIIGDYLDTGVRTKEPGCCAEDPIFTAVVGKDEILERLIRLYYREESEQDCRFLSANVFEADILPRLSEEYDRYYYVTKESDPDYELLKRSGYRFWHKPWFAMPGNTHETMTLNPHKKEQMDAAPEDVEKISFKEYLKLFE